MKKKFYYQTYASDSHRWEDNKPFMAEFHNREDAVEAAYLLSKALGNAVIRFTDNEYYKTNSGSYIQSK